MENKQIYLKNLINSIVVINVPDLHLNRVWERKGARKPIPADTLREAIYDPSVEYLLWNGILEIEDAEFRKEIGLEGAETSPETYLVPSDAEMKRLLTVMPIYDFKDKVAKMNREQVQAIVAFAIEHDLIDYDKDEVLKQIIDVDVIRAVQLKKADEGK